MLTFLLIASLLHQEAIRQSFEHESWEQRQLQGTVAYQIFFSPEAFTPIQKGNVRRVIGGEYIPVKAKSSECTVANLTKALEMAMEGKTDPNPSSQDPLGSFIFIDAPTLTIDTRTPAQKLRAKADQLEQASRDYRWMKHLLEECR